MEILDRMGNGILIKGKIEGDKVLLNGERLHMAFAFQIVIEELAEELEAARTSQEYKLVTEKMESAEKRVVKFMRNYYNLSSSVEISFLIKTNKSSPLGVDMYLLTNSKIGDMVDKKYGIPKDEEVPLAMQMEEEKRPNLSATNKYSGPLFKPSKESTLDMIKNIKRGLGKR